MSYKEFAMAYETIALLGPGRDVNSWEVYRALELLDAQRGFNHIMVLNHPPIIRDVAQEYSVNDYKRFTILDIRWDLHGPLAHISAMWELLANQIDLVIYFGPKDIQLQNAMCLVKHVKYQTWEPFEL